MKEVLVHNSTSCPPRTSRREFLKLAAAGLLAGCSPAQKPAVTPTSTPTGKPVPTAAPSPTTASRPTSTPTPTATPLPMVEARRPEIIQFYPDVPSKVVRVHHSGVWSGGELAPDALRQMLDALITELTGLNDAREAWAALFAPDERIAIKVNALRGRCLTHAPLVMAVTECLQTAGVPAEQIVIFDRYTDDLKYAGHAINHDGPGVRCYGTNLTGPGSRSSAAKNDHYVTGWKVIDTDVGLSDILMSCHALINMPILKSAMLPEVGMTFGMKNHYGTFDRPADFHGDRFRRGVAELNALPPIKDRTRLIIGDVLTLKANRPRQIVGVENTIMASFDPVAHDTVGLQMTSEALNAEGRDPAAATTPASLWLATSAELGLGTNDPTRIDLQEVNLG
jgi:uncharacterized protein (DUF362 family)